MLIKQIILSTIEHSNTDQALLPLGGQRATIKALPASPLLPRPYGLGFSPARMEGLRCPGLVTGSDGNWRKVDRVSSVSGVLCIKEQIASILLHFILEWQGLF
jgi:hypothetical protein